MTALPARAGVSFRHEHARGILARRPDIGWFEVHAENYMGAGGPPHRLLTALRAHWPVSLHGVGLSIGGEGPLDRGHLARLAGLVERYAPASFSEHLAWSSHEGTAFNDLLPLPYTEEALARICAHVDQVQEALGMRMLLENPTSYAHLPGSDIPETEFLAAIARTTGCGLLLDVNNVHISATNLGFDAGAYLDAFPLAEVGEIHLAGHCVEIAADGTRLLLDSHDRPVAEAVWQLFAGVIARTGPVPTLVEWDADIPDWPELAAEAATVDRLLAEAAAASAPGARGPAVPALTDD
ncbi:DUF692 domain-containing protein (plasmid) [Paroceanicella profunda]|uniref:UPF0276 protein FDP22_19015 n=1 Tax=Paroceanicella profunda TaxID=2579971 RepID=A0A5B8FYH8_9RHOB|nr:DUF692 domain-containing protein [Paroceanicella profunda]QDL93966.1 DUF692 domain-containing protein [Paroceanicella profunda]